MTLAVFLEPNPVMAGYLRKRMGSLKEHGFSFGNLTIIQAALCANDSSSVPFYGISPRILDAFPDFHLNYTSMFHSLDKDWFLHAFRNYDFDRHGYPPERWDEALTYVEETPVRCLTASSLLQEIGKEAKDIDVLTVDAEGLDVELVTMFASMDDFFPALVAFEVFALRSINDHFCAQQIWASRQPTCCKRFGCFSRRRVCTGETPYILLAMEFVDECEKFVVVYCHFKC